MASSGQSVLSRFMRHVTALPRARKRLILVTLDFVVLVALVWVSY
jgi:hypothetical protein